MIYYGYFIKRLPVEKHENTLTDGMKIIQSDYPVECYFLKSSKDVMHGKKYTHISAYYGAAEGDIIDVFEND